VFDCFFGAAKASKKIALAKKVVFKAAEARYTGVEQIDTEDLKQ